MYKSEFIAEEKDIKKTMKCKGCFIRTRIALCAIVYVLYIIGSSITPADATISRSSGRRHVMDISSRDIEVAVDVSPSSHARGAGAHGNGRRLRPRRSSNEEFYSFRRLLHEIRNRARGRPGYPTILRRSDADTVSERASTGNQIASKVKCGGCQLKNQWVPVSKPGCKTNYVLAPTCRGMCETWEIPDVNPPYVTTHHRVCRPAKIEYRKIRLRKCNPGVNAYHIFPMAQSCQCLKCKSWNTACRPLL